MKIEINESAMVAIVISVIMICFMLVEIYGG